RPTCCTGDKGEEERDQNDRTLGSCSLQTGPTHRLSGSRNRRKLAHEHRRHVSQVEPHRARPRGLLWLFRSVSEPSAYFPERTDSTIAPSRKLARSCSSASFVSVNGK